MKIKLIQNTFYWLTITLLMVACVLLISSALNLPYGIKLYSVMSGSMSPSIPVGSIIISQKGSYKTGDVIIYQSNNSSITHRIIGVNNAEEESFYLTKGDANNAADGNLVPKSSVVGKVLFTIPLLGYFSSFIKTLPGLIVLIVIPATIIIYSETLNMKRAIAEMFSKKHPRKTGWEKINSRQLILLLLFFLTVSLLNIDPSISYYATSYSVVSSTFTTSNLFPTLTLNLSTDKKTVSFTVKNISQYVKLSYKLTYDTQSMPQGLEGQVTLHGENEFNRDITLGICSSGGICVYHSGVNNIKLEVKLDYPDGNSTFLQKTL